MKFNLKRDVKTLSGRKGNSHKIRNNDRLNFLPPVRYFNFLRLIFQTLNIKNTHRLLIVDGRTALYHLPFLGKLS